MLSAGKDTITQADTVMRELQRLSQSDPDWDWKTVAVIGRRWEDLEPVRAWCETQGISVQLHKDKPLPFWGLRETQCFVDWCFAQDSRLLDRAAWATWLSECPVGPYWDLLREALDAYGLIAGDAEQSIEVILDWLAEWGRDLRQRQTGLLLTTAHGAKGLEFAHVAVLDGNWMRHQKGEDPDSPRRLYYVAMTRAKKTLLLAHKEASNVLLDTLPNSVALLSRSLEHHVADNPELHHTYATLSMGDVDLGFAGRKNPQDAVHAWIKVLQPGDFLKVDFASRTIFDSAGNPIGRLATSYQAPVGKRCVRASVAAILVRTKVRTEEKYRQHTKVERWEVVVPELVFNSANTN
ncbi:MAG: 3'-5' exonuclease, partial [Acidithiobacillus sp.]